MKDDRKDLGHSGESLAAEFLKSQGYVIVEQNFRAPVGEIDIIAREKGVLCFVEVKTRRGTRYGSPFAAVTRAKQRRLVLLARWYLKYRRYAKVRFDVVSVLKSSAGSAKIELVRNAFHL